MNGIAAVRRLWRSLSFRLVFHYGLLVTITMLVTLTIIYVQTAGVVHQQTVRRTQTTVQGLRARFEEGGTEALAAQIRRLASDGSDPDQAIYLLTDAQGTPRAGNLDRVPAAFAAGDHAGQMNVTRQGVEVSAYLVGRHLPDGSLLVVGHGLQDAQALESLMAGAFKTAAAIAMLLLIGGTFVFRREVERSLAAMRRTAARVATGQLQERVPVDEVDDEFALLGSEINRMLDRIESLMDGVRHVSNTIAHNLRTPLMRILAHLHAAQAADDAPVARREAIVQAMREIEELAVVFEKLLQIAQAEAGARRMHFAPVALDRVADDVVEFYEAVAETQHASLRREPAEPAFVLGDPDLLASAIANLIDNALKYAGEGASIRVGTRSTPDQMLLTVQDDGPGIPDAAHARIGEYFHRLDRRTPGYGLGLASVKAIVALHDGQIEFGDAAPGLVVTIRLPVPAG